MNIFPPMNFFSRGKKLENLKARPCPHVLICPKARVPKEAGESGITIKRTLCCRKPGIYLIGQDSYNQENATSGALVPYSLIGPSWFSANIFQWSFYLFIRWLSCLPFRNSRNCTPSSKSCAGHMQTRFGLTAIALCWMLFHFTVVICYQQLLSVSSVFFDRLMDFPFCK